MPDDSRRRGPVAQAGERPPGWWTRRRIRNARRLTPTPFQRIRSAIALVVLVGVFGVALAVGFGICLVVGAFLLESLAG